jgi:acyl-CoA dehydrogenase
MAWEVVDRAMQTFGAMGMTKELPLQLMASKLQDHADLRRAHRGA